MLAQNFKTAKELGIKKAEFDALFKVLGMLERREIEFQIAETAFHYNNEYDPFQPRFFNMRYFEGETECGTVACICGWAEFVGKLPKGELMTKRFRLPALDDLFDPTGRYNYDEIELHHAAIALRNYLTHGEPRWDEALAA